MRWLGRIIPVADRRFQPIEKAKRFPAAAGAGDCDNWTKSAKEWLTRLVGSGTLKGLLIGTALAEVMP